jgi:hypothetical protein
MIVDDPRRIVVWSEKRKRVIAKEKEETTIQW